MCTLLDEKTRRARKPHECDMCGVTIGSGEEYCWEKYVNGDGLYELKTCLACDVAFSEVTAVLLAIAAVILGYLTCTGRWHR